jgi:SSS family solute:Na+ symporter
MENVLSLMLYAYAFMVSGLLVPIVAALVLKQPRPLPALASMIAGGGISIVLIIADTALPYGLDPNVFGLTGAVLAYWITSIIHGCKSDETATFRIL